MSMTREEAAHILEYSRIVSENFTQEAVTATYVMALAALRGPTREMVERMRGEWINKHSAFDHKIFICSRCGKQISIQGENLSFCPSCGQPKTDEAVGILWKSWKETVVGETCGR